MELVPATAPSFTLERTQQPKQRERLRLVTHTPIDVDSWEPELLAGYYPGVVTHPAGSRPWQGLQKAIKNLKLWDARLADQLLARPETSRHYQCYKGSILIFVGSEYEETGFKIARKAVCKKPRRVFRGLKICAEGYWEEVIIPKGRVFLRGLHLIAVVP